MKLFENRELKGYVQVFAGGALWGTIGPFVMLMDHYGSTSALTSFLRMFFAFLILAAVTVLKFGTKVFKVDRRTLVSCMLLGLICQGIYNVFYTLTVLKAGVTFGSVMLRIAPVFTTIVSMMLFSEKMTKIKALALIVNIGGCFLAVTGGGAESAVQISLAGILLGIGSGFTYAMTPIISRIAGSKANAFVISTYSYFFAALFLLFYARPWGSGVPVSTGLLLSGIGFALIPTAIAYVIYYSGVQKISESSKVPILASVETVVASILGVGLFHERVGLLNVIGIVLVMVSIALLNERQEH